MKALVVIEELAGVASRDSLGLLSRLAYLGLDLDAVVLAPDAEAAVAGAVAHGAARVFVARNSSFADTPVEPRVSLLERLCRTEGFDTIMFATSAQSVDIAGRLAARLEAGIAWNLATIDVINGELCAKRSALADAVLAEVQWETAVRVGLTRPRTFEPVVHVVERSAEILDVECSDAASKGGRVVARRTSTAAPAIASADIVVSGGRGLVSPENLDLVRDLAQALGGAPGVSLPLVDMGWAPRAMQVGQTGTQVQPGLYIACGISGQFQHKIGMERSGAIVAINIDRNAPIMSFCDLAVIGDVRQILPRLTALIKAEAKSRSGCG